MPPLLTLTPLSTPPEDTVSTPPLRIVVELPLPPETMTSVPLFPTNAVLAMPPEETTVLPPLLIVSPRITPPDATSTVAPDTAEPLNNSVNCGEGGTLTPVSVVVSAATVTVPVLMVSPPSATLAPALKVTLDSVAPAYTTSVPPLDITAP